MEVDGQSNNAKEMTRNIPDEVFIKEVSEDGVVMFTCIQCDFKCRENETMMNHVRREYQSKGLKRRGDTEENENKKCKDDEDGNLDNSEFVNSFIAAGRGISSDEDFDDSINVGETWQI